MNGGRYWTTWQPGGRAKSLALLERFLNRYWSESRFNEPCVKRLAERYLARHTTGHHWERDTSKPRQSIDEMIARLCADAMWNSEKELSDNWNGVWPVPKRNRDDWKTWLNEQTGTCPNCDQMTIERGPVRLGIPGAVTCTECGWEEGDRS